MAEYIRRYNLKHENFNRHQKYKSMRPIFPLNFDLGLIRAEIETHAETASDLAEVMAEAEELEIVNGAKRRQIQEPVVSHDYGLVTLET